MKMIKQRKRKYYQCYKNGNMIWWNEVQLIKGKEKLESKGMNLNIKQKKS